MKSLVVALIGLGCLVGCGNTDSKAAGAFCFGSAECAPGLTCDFGQDPAVCAVGQTGASDAASEVVDAARIDSGGEDPDAAAVIDAAVADANLPDAGEPDAAVDAGEPDAQI